MRERNAAALCSCEKHFHICERLFPSSDDPSKRKMLEVFVSTNNCFFFNKIDMCAR